MGADMETPPVARPSARVSPHPVKQNISEGAAHCVVTYCGHVIFSGQQV